MDMDVGDIGHLNMAIGSQSMFPSLNPTCCRSQSDGRPEQRQREEGEIMMLHRRMQTVSKGIPGTRLLHLDRDAGQKTPTCIFDPLTGPRIQDPGLRAQGLVGPPLRTHRTQDQGSSRPQHLQLTPVTAPSRTAWVAFDRCYRCRTVYTSHMGTMHARPDRQTDGIWGLEMLDCREALDGHPLAPSAASFCKSSALLLVLCVVLCCFCVLPCSIAICCRVCFPWLPRLVPDTCDGIQRAQGHKTRGMKKP